LDRLSGLQLDVGELQVVSCDCVFQGITSASTSAYADKKTLHGFRTHVQAGDMIINGTAI
jgi:hypothetical protein